jgi:hypothetical protein
MPSVPPTRSQFQIKAGIDSQLDIQHILYRKLCADLVYISNSTTQV